MNNKDVTIDIDNNCKLRTLTQSDVNEKYVSWLNDYEIVKYTEQKYFNHSFLSESDYVRQKNNSNNELLLGIFFNNDHIGNVKLGPIRWEHMAADVSYFIGDKNYWGRGIATKCVNSVVKYGIEFLFLKRIGAGYYELNIGSEKVLKKCGFNFEGRRISDVKFEGKRIDSILVGYVP